MTVNDAVSNLQAAVKARISAEADAAAAQEAARAAQNALTIAQDEEAKASGALVMLIKTAASAEKIAPLASIG